MKYYDGRHKEEKMSRIVKKRCRERGKIDKLEGYIHTNWSNHICCVRGVLVNVCSDLIGLVTSNRNPSHNH